MMVSRERLSLMMKHGMTLKTMHRNFMKMGREKTLSFVSMKTLNMACRSSLKMMRRLMSGHFPAGHARLWQMALSASSWRPDRAPTACW